MGTTPILSHELRQKNRAAVFRQFLAAEGLTRQELSALLELSLPTVTQYLRELQGAGLIRQIGSAGGTGGRRANMYALHAQARTAVGLNITRTHVTAVALDLRGTLLSTVQRHLEFDRSDRYFQSLGDVVKETIHAAGLEPAQVLGVGIGMPGLLTADKQALFYCAALRFSEVRLEELSRHIPYPTALCHDTAAAGFAEIWNSPDISTAFYLMLSDSIGGSIYIDGEVYEGQNLRAGEVGHIPLVPGGKPCYCGHRGCMDAYRNAGVLSGAAGGSLERFFRLLRQGNPQIQSVWQEYLQYLAQTILHIRMLFDCTIILGGYVGGHIAPYMDQLRGILAGLDPFDHSGDYLMACQYQTESVATGAALQYICEYRNRI